MTMTASVPTPTRIGAHDTARLGATYLGDHRCRFVLWAPHADRVDLCLVGDTARLLPMERAAGGYWHLNADHVAPGARYTYRLDGGPERPDPVSRYQPDGPHGSSAVVDAASFPWTDDDWKGIPLKDYVLYEIHVGTFSPEGTFEGVIPYLTNLAELGVTAIEIMPVAQFAGGRNWGYDGVQPYAVQNTYGGPEGLRKLVDAAHTAGLAVTMDVVYNHLGPEGNYLWDFARDYFTDRYRTPWGTALNFDVAYSDEVRRYFLENAMMWPTEFHIDSLRLDAVHSIIDFSAVSFLSDLAASADTYMTETGKRFYLMGESDLNDSRLLRPREGGGYGLHAQWSDDFHHILHVLLTGERDGYYSDFKTVSQLKDSLERAYVFNGTYSPYRHRRHGNSTDGLRPEQFVVCIQNHDQIGNRMRGDRLAETLPFPSLKLAAAMTILSPYLPLLFMGEEYGEQALFPYFISHTDPDLVEAVRKGRREEMATFSWAGEVPDPAGEETFARAKLHHDLRHEGWHEMLWRWYQATLTLRTQLPPLGPIPFADLTVNANDASGILTMLRGARGSRYFLAFNFADAPSAITAPDGAWDKTLDSEGIAWGGDDDDLPDTLSAEAARDLIMPPLSVVVWHERQA